MKIEAQKNSETSIKCHKEEILWNRFVKVRRSVQAALIQKQKPDFERELSTRSWSGVDAGIHDHKGSFNGTSSGILLNFKIEGTTVENNPEYIIDDNGEWHLIHKNKQYLSIKGNYVCPDGMDGKFDFRLNNWVVHTEAYWLTCMNTHYRLEQVVGPEGAVFNATRLPDDGRNQVTVPGTNVTIPRAINKRIPQ